MVPQRVRLVKSVKQELVKKSREAALAATKLLSEERGKI